MSDYVHAWFRAYLSTLLIEIPVVSGWLWPDMGWSSIFWGFAASTITHPVLWFVWPQWGPRWLWVGSAEITIWLVEGALYAWALRGKTGAWRRGIGLSGLANGSSLLAGLLLQS